MNTDPFECFPAQEREELALCGITTAEQLAACKVERVAADLRQARDFFPGRCFVLTEERLRDMLAAVHAPQTTMSDSRSADIPHLHARGKSLPTTGLHHSSEKEPEEITANMTHYKGMLHTPVRSSHPDVAVLAAVSTFLLVIPVVFTIAFVAAVITGTLPETPVPLPVVLVVFIVLPVLPYLIFARLATCPVCHIRIFRLHRYTRNRAAHRFPLLGYNLSTALHLIFRAFYICPGCGTPVRLTGSKGPRKKH